jgi:hypothetical protein
LRPFSELGPITRKFARNRIIIKIIESIWKPDGAADGQLNCILSGLELQVWEKPVRKGSCIWKRLRQPRGQAELQEAPESTELRGRPSRKCSPGPER